MAIACTRDLRSCGGAGRQDIPSGGTDEAAFANLGEMLALATYPKVAVKLSGAPSYSSHPYLRQVFDAFGPQRCFWGTDITRMPPEAPYPASLADIHSGCPTGA
ncbi:MAG TPA: amidohydrolase family protein [Candidatus Saccharimonadia bacterium]|nr:amidohydrolase family protein [Candidatus Saccharimonadia bacterium]